ncbi:dynein axonemal heavy chain 8-like [Rhincodon typus]|uniref:dynein axonemal heavy chain 8-like n=1 Tax=Rhincodon typus TaxID=259920 RepID=UPI00202EF4E4|nr:dynein axonemal heavy chain 8-like [Rhincodon typus]
MHTKSKKLEKLSITISTNQVSSGTTMGKCIVNLCDHTLQLDEIEVLSQGLNYCPSTKMDPIGLMADTEKFIRRMRLSEFFRDVSKSGRIIAGLSKGSKMMRLFQSDFSSVCLTGLCLFFVRYKNDIAITGKNIHEEIYFCVLDCTDGILTGAAKMLGNIFVHAISASDKWGALNQSIHGHREKKAFKDIVRRYIRFLNGALTSLEKAAVLKSETVDLSQLRSFEQVTAAASNPEIILQLENVLLMWHNQLEQVLAQSNQVRKEAEGSGPLTELEHWKCTSAKFNSIIEQLKGQHCKAVINVLNTSHSKMLKMWLELDSQITDAANEAKDNVKFLQALEKVCQPLYNSDPVTMTKGVPNLINTIQMIHNVSRYYNTSQQMTSLFIKITNQMVTACKEYITEDGTARVWDQDSEVVINKMKECKKLLVEYRKYFQNTKKYTTETAQDTPFDVSEMYIFGKLEVFCKRLAKITEMVVAVKTFSALQNSTIEGIEILAIKFQNIYLNLKKSHYDILDPRKKEFNSDYAVFMKQIFDLENLLNDFMSNSFAQINSSRHSLHLLKRFQSLNIPSLESEIEVIVERIIQHYAGELMFVNKHYQINKEDPPLARNMPPIAGKILWVRQLFKRIHEPIDYFYVKSKQIFLKASAVPAMDGREDKSAASFYFISKWTFKLVLQATLLVRDPETGKLYSNFDHRILEILRESKCMLKMDLEIPEIAKRLLKIENTLKSNCNNLESVLHSFETVCQRIPSEFMALITPKVNKIESILRQGVTLLNWSSLTLDQFFADANAAINELITLLKTLIDLREMHIDEVLYEIAQKIMINLPEDHTLTLENMVAYNEVSCSEWADILAPKAGYIEITVNKLVDIFIEISETINDATKSDIEPVDQLRGFHTWFDRPRNPLTVSAGPQSNNNLHSTPCLQPAAHLLSAAPLTPGYQPTPLGPSGILRCSRSPAHCAPALIYSTPLQAFSLLRLAVSCSRPSACSTLALSHSAPLQVSSPLCSGSQPLQAFSPLCSSSQLLHSTLGSQLLQEINENRNLRKPKNFYHNVAEHKDVTKLVAMLSTSVNTTRDTVVRALEQFQRFNQLWLQDRDTTVKKFMDSNPSLYELRAKIEYYAGFEREIEELSSIVTVDFIELNTEAIKLAFLVEAKAWKMVLCRFLNEQYKEKMAAITAFIVEEMKNLARPIQDLDDVRFAMESLSQIRNNEIQMDMTLGPIEEAYSILNKYGMEISKEETEEVDTLRYFFNKLQVKARNVQDELVQVQPKFKANLLESVDVFQKEVLKYGRQYEKEGPMVPGIAPAEASTRLQIFQSWFDELWRKFVTYSSGERLFGLPVQDYEILQKNKYNAYYKKDIQLWVHNLTACTTIIEQWLLVQNLWIYLEAVFVGGDIAKQLPQEAKRFQNVDKSWIKIMQRAHEIPIVVHCCVGDDIMGQLLPHLQEQLEVCQKSLTGYLEKKRLLFPRFFFVSDPALLEILGQASDSHTIQAHLAGIFDNVNEAVFHPKEYDTILAVTSREGEKIHLDHPVIAKGPVELWLSDLLRVQQASLHTVIKLAYYSFSEPDFQLIPFLYEAPGQVGILAIQILWTRDSEDALRLAKDSKKIMQTTNQKFLELLNSLIAQTTHDLTKFQRIQFETLVTIHVHQRDIFDDLVKMHIRTVSDFEWLKQSRFYFNDDIQEIKVRITDVEFIYQNEFLGCTDRLVITPLTDRCYITLAQALWMNMGAAPAGPAGTGKTETVKDMGKALGKYVVVFNCSDQMDFRGLGRIYKGLAQSGSWGCFDEFNRIELPVLSVAAQQIYIILMARKERKKQFIFTDGDNVSLNPEFGIFITMNPGYAGRQELPENLKIQFRTVAMMVPDRQIIIRVKLASVGFLDNVLLAQKFFVLYKLCEEQLTKQVHYDFGLRNILSVLRTLGAQKRARPEDSEQTIVMRVLRDMNLSKLVDEDEPLFLSLISDLFPGIQLDSSTYVELQAAVANQVEIAGLVNHPPWNLKLVQLYETARVRHGLMTLGPSGSGKTCVIRILMHSLTECGAPHREMRMNPKAITAPQMFGRLDPSTNDWTDGIFSTLWRKSIKSKKGDNIWIILDGPVDAIWIENLNSVLDDNKTLTLANGDRIPMAPSCKLLFEVHNIENASPATVSRMGMVYISSSALSWKPILKAWLNKRIPWEAEILQNLYDVSFEDAYLYMKLNLHPVMELLECNYIVQFQIPSYEFLTEKLQFYQRQHNEGVRSGFLDLVFFKDAMTHIMKISRIIRTDCGNALLVGVGGSGKQSFTKLASYIAGYKIFQITLTRAYSVTNLMDDLKILYRTAGAEGKGITFIFTDNDIKEESFLEYLNNVLSSGEVSNLFARDELDEITQSLIAPMKKEAPRIPPTFDNLYEYFIKRARKNLHVVLCFSPVGEKFRSRAMKFPGLISGCTMDWFSRWPREALVAVSHYFLSGFYIACSAEVKTQLVSTMGVFHDKVYQTCEDYFQRYRRRTHITPKSYLAFINSYKTIYKEKHVNINDLAEHMQLGLSKLMEATESVALLSKELAGKEKELAVASRNADKVLGEVTVSAQAAELVKNEVLIVKIKAQKIVEEIEADKNIAEGKLIAAKPALEAAEAALNTIKPADISTVRKLAKPPHLIMRILDCVLVLFQKKMDAVTMDPERPCLKPSWGESLKLLSGTGFLQALQQFPKDTINDETVELLQPYFMMEDYTFEHAKKVCGNVAGLLSWTQAMASFFAINKEVLPLKANLAVQENRLQRAMKELGSAQAQLDEKQAELDKVQAKFDAAMKEKMDLLEDAETCRRKMEAASALIDGLSGEKIRWTEQCKEFKAQINRLVGDVLLATGFLSYSGPFNQTFRDILLKVIWEVELQKKKIPYTDNLNIIAFLVDQAMIGEWNLQGLPSDDLSVQNGIIVTKATRYPLLIDPQTQGKTWIKRKEKDNELQVTSLNHKYFRNHLEDSLSLGRPLLLEDVQEELDPALDNVLEKNFIKSGTSFKVKVGDKEIDVMAGFMFYITTKLPNPAYTPEISAKTSIIDFTVTIKGLENQLLGRVILTEKQVKSWCPDRILSQARHYIAEAMEAKYAEPVILNLETTWEESDAQTPLICFLSMGSDPSNQIEGLAKKLEIDCRAISMGQGQEVHARKLVAMSMHEGGWVLLQNCHLGLAFMDELLETLLISENVHDSFRVWLTTEPHPKFPITLLQTSIKYTNEPPQGVRAGLKRTFTGITQDQIEYSNLPMWRPLLYAVAFLHTTVQGVSWNTIRYMLGEVQYGGRVTDDYDKRLLNCFCKVWFNEKMFDSKFSFYTDYIIPICASVESYLEYIQTLPAVDTPQVFGLHPNADITYQSNTAAEILNTITNIQPKESAGGAGETREATVFKLADSMLLKLPPDYLAHEVKARLIKMGILNSMNIFLRQEIDRMQRVITMLRNCLNDLKLAIEGTIIMSENLTDALDNMYNARVPVVWKRISWDSSTLGFWFTEFLERNAQFSSWIFEGRPNVFWMPGFFNPQGFLTAMRQEVTRAHKGWALDSVTLHNEVTKLMKEEIKIPPPEGVYIYGLYLDGAGWDRRNIRLTESTAKVLFTMLPVIYMFAINSTAPKDPKLYICPVYKKPQRTDLTFITALCLKTIQPPDHWILRGAALLCDIK